jgi:hypothetical protein
MAVGESVVAGEVLSANGPDAGRLVRVTTPFDPAVALVAA